MVGASPVAGSTQAIDCRADTSAAWMAAAADVRTRRALSRPAVMDVSVASHRSIPSTFLGPAQPSPAVSMYRAGTMAYSVRVSR